MKGAVVSAVSLQTLRVCQEGAHLEDELTDAYIGGTALFTKAAGEAFPYGTFDKSLVLALGYQLMRQKARRILFSGYQART